MTGVYTSYYADQWVLRDLSLVAETGKITVLLGPNGAGKSTALKVLYGMLRASQGEIRLGGEDITRLGPHRRLAKGLAFLTQEHTLFPGMTVDENLELGAAMLRRDRRQFRAAVDAAYEQYQILRGLRHKLAGSLSGGQQRILELARLMLTDPDVLLIDEPSNGVAPNLVDVAYDAMLSWRKRGKTILLVDQDLEAAGSVADYIYTIESGQNRLAGPAEQLSGRLRELVSEWLNVHLTGENG
jgi:branched-chain amino acid transport system ATP-binding protein